MVQWITALIHQDLSLNPQNLCEKKAYPSIGHRVGVGQKQEVPEAPWLAILSETVIFWFSERLCLKAIPWGEKERHHTFWLCVCV